MIFCKINEAGVSTCQLVLDKRKTVTRRLKPQPVGKVRAVQAGRGKPAQGHIKILSCERGKHAFTTNFDQEQEAFREGFRTWKGLLAALGVKSQTEMLKFYRIEFKLVDKLEGV